MFAKSNRSAAVPNSSEQTRIALWGPTGVGKDWLFRAFAKELEYFNRTDNGFQFEIFETQPGESVSIPFISVPPEQSPTPSFEDHNYQFRRTAMVHDVAHQISSQVHDIILHNNKGSNLVDSLNDRVAFEDTFQVLLDAQNILLVLGIPEEMMGTHPVPDVPALPPEPNFLDSEMNEQPVFPVGMVDAQFSGSRWISWSRTEYLKFMQLFLSSLRKSPRCNLAVCMTKSDQLSYRGDPMDVLQRRYGDALRRLLEVHRQNHNIEVFISSAAGYLKQDGRSMANFQNGGIRDPKRWNPVNTAAPFFWVFEQIERDRLQKGFALFRSGNQKSYIPYPRPRSF